MFCNAVAIISNVAGNSWNQLGGNTLNLIFDLIIIEIKMLGPDQEGVIDLPLLDALEQASGKLH